MPILGEFVNNYTNVMTTIISEKTSPGAVRAAIQRNIATLESKLKGDRSQEAK